MPGQRSKLRSHQSRPFNERRRRRVVLGYAAAITAAVSFLFVSSRLSFLPALSIETVEVYGADASITPAMETAAYGAIQGSYLGLFSKSNALIYPGSAVAAAVASLSPKVETVSVELSGMRSLAVSVSEKAPAAVVCADLPNWDENGALLPESGCYFADEDGLIFDQAPEDAGDLYNRYYVPGLSGSDRVIGLFATSTAEFKSLQGFMDSVKAAGIRTEAMLMEDGGEYELYAHNPPAVSTTSSEGSVVVIHFNDAAGLRTERDNLVLFWSSMTDKAKAAGAAPEWSDIKLQYPPNIDYTETK
ncbi:MAG: hypothetical protein ABSF56_02545 [Minisyncoccia bacterium]|jgi:hypothetical protein